MHVELATEALRDAVRKIWRVGDSQRRWHNDLDLDLLALDGELGLATIAKSCHAGVRVPARVVQGGGWSVPLRELGDLLDLLPGDRVELTTPAPSRLEVGSGRVSARFAAERPRFGFPLGAPRSGWFRADGLFAAVRAAAHPLAPWFLADEKRHFFQISLERGLFRSRLRLAATDGHRASYRALSVPRTPSDWPSDTVLQGSSLRAATLLMECEDDVRFGIAPPYFLVSDGVAIAEVPFLEWSPPVHLPTYMERLPPAAGLRTAREPVLEALDRLSGGRTLFGKESSMRGFVVELFVEADTVSVVMRGEHISVRETLPARVPPRLAGTEMVLHGTFLVDALGSFTADDVEIDVLEAGPPTNETCLFARPVGDPETFALMMPRHPDSILALDLPTARRELGA